MLTEDEKIIMEYFQQYSEEELALMDLKDEDYALYDSLLVKSKNAPTPPGEIPGMGSASPLITDVGDAEGIQEFKKEQATQRFLSDWDRADLTEKAEYLLRIDPELGDIKTAYEYAMGYPYSAKDQAVKSVFGEDPSFLRKAATRSQDVLSAPGRLIGAGVDAVPSAIAGVTNLFKDEDNQSKIQEDGSFGESFSKRGGEQTTADMLNEDTKRGFLGSLGQDIVRDWTNIPLIVAGGPLTKVAAKATTAGNVAKYGNRFSPKTLKAIIAGSEKGAGVIPRAQGLAARTGQYLNKVQPKLNKHLLTGVMEGGLEGGLKAADRISTEGNDIFSEYGLSNIAGDAVLNGTIGGVFGAGAGVAGDAVGNLLQKGGLKALASKGGGVIPQSEVGDMFRKADLDAGSKKSSWDHYLAGVHADPFVTKTPDGSFVNRSTGETILDPANTTALYEPNMSTAMENVSVLTNPQGMAEQLGEVITKSGEIRKEVLTSSPTLDSPSYNKIFANIQSKLDNLLETGKIKQSAYESAVAKIDTYRKDYPFESFVKKGEGLAPVHEARKELGTSKGFNPKSVTKDLFREELDGVLGSRVEGYRKMDRSLLAPLAGAKNALEGVKSDWSDKIVQQTKSWVNPSKWLDLIVNDPTGVKRLRNADKLMTPLDLPGESGVLSENFIQLVRDGKITPAGARRARTKTEQVVKPVVASGAREYSKDESTMSPAEKRWIEYVASKQSGVPSILLGK